MSLFPAIAPFTFSGPPGNALHKNKPVQNCIACRRRKAKCDRLQPCTPCKNRGEADSCEQHVKETYERPTGYTHVSDTSILANRVCQLELVLSRLITRVDSVDNYKDLLHSFTGPLPVFRPSGKGEDAADSGSSVKKGNNRRLTKEGSALTIADGSEPMDSIVLGDPVESHSSDMKSQQKTVTFDESARSSVFPTPTSAAIALAHLPIQPQLQRTAPHAFSAQDDSFVNPGHLASMEMIGMDQQNQSVSMSRSIPPPIDLHQSAGLDSYNGATPDWLGLLEVKGDDIDGNGSQSFRSFVDAPLIRGQTQFSEPVSKVPSAHEHDASLALEGMALGRDFMEEPGSGGDAVLDLVSDASPSHIPTFTSFIQHKRPTDAGSAKKPFPAASQLPSLIVGKYVMDHYFNDVNFLWRCFHRPTFDKQYADLCVQLRSRSKEFTLDHLSTLALYSAILCVGIHFLEEDGYRDLNLTEVQAVEMAATCWKVAYEALEASDWMQVYNIRSCQTIIIAGLYMSSIRRANHHWALLGVATKIALALGLNDIPDESKIVAAGTAANFHPRWRSAITREVGRRVWHSLVELDWLFSMEHGFVYIIPAEIHHTSEPANIDDVDIKDDMPVIAAPPDTHTEMSYFIHRHRILYPLQGVIRNVRSTGRMRYSFVVDAQEALQRAAADRPLFYRHPDNFDSVFDAVQLERIKREARSLQEATDLRTLRIHRAYFPAACENPRYLLTKQTCLSGARRMLLNPALDRAVAHQLNSHYWAFAYYTFAATVVTVIYLRHALPQELEEFKMLAERGIDRLSALSGKGRTDLGDTADTLQALMQVQLDRRQDAHSATAVSPKRNFAEFSADNWSNWVLPSFDQTSNATLSAFDIPTGLSSADDHNLTMMLDSLFQDVANGDTTLSFL